MQNKKIGYVAIQFTPETNQEVVKWSHGLKEEDIVTATIGVETEGGNVTNKLHLTLFYGFNDEALDKNELSQFIDQIKLKKIKVSGIGLFSVKEYNCNTLYLKVSDGDGELRKMHEEFRKFPHFSECQKLEYIPHVTIAYVMKDFKIDRLTKNLPSILHIHKVQYILSSSAMGMSQKI